MILPVIITLLVGHHTAGLVITVIGYWLPLAPLLHITILVTRLPSLSLHTRHGAIIIVAGNNTTIIITHGAVIIIGHTHWYYQPLSLPVNIIATRLLPLLISLLSLIHYCMELLLNKAVVGMVINTITAINRYWLLLVGWLLLHYADIIDA